MIILTSTHLGTTIKHFISRELFLPQEIQEVPMVQRGISGIRLKKESYQSAKSLKPWTECDLSFSLFFLQWIHQFLVIQFINNLLVMQNLKMALKKANI